VSDPTQTTLTTLETLTKPWWQSRTVIGAAVTIISGVASAIGYGIPADVQGQVVDLLATGGALAGGVLALWGRIKADRAVTFRNPR